MLQFKIVTFLPCHFYSVFTFRKQLTSNSQTPFLLYKLLSEVHPCIAPRHVLSSSLLAAIGHNSGLGCTPYPSNTSVVKWHSHLTQMQQPMWKDHFISFLWATLKVSWPWSFLCHKGGEKNPLHLPVILFQTKNILFWRWCVFFNHCLFNHRPPLGNWVKHIHLIEIVWKHFI